ncbi:hypothetical protein [uncultured Megasphaera sp.]|uniref:hypothetical protein n=1 Tax=uncultured Megasphaera sp. TaxID=165188 RepID=UPI00266D9494|nr:hypothetical protein [uncultured Megasphaera sp.]
MNQLFRFLRNLDKRKLIFILQRARAILLPIRPYAECGRTDTCPCPIKKKGIQGIAIGGQTASVEIGTRSEF